MARARWWRRWRETTGAWRCFHGRASKGLGTAYRDGFRRALNEGAQYILEMDADFSHDPGYLPQLVEAAETHYDLVVGSRYVHGGSIANWGVVRRFVSRSANVYAGLVLGLPIADSTSGFRCYRRQVLEALDLNAVYSEGYLFQIEMVCLAQHAGFRIGEVPITFTDRRVGQSKMSLRIVMEAVVGVWYLRSGMRTGAREQRRGGAKVQKCRGVVSPAPPLPGSSVQLRDRGGHG